MHTSGRCVQLGVGASGGIAFVSSLQTMQDTRSTDTLVSSTDMVLVHVRDRGALPGREILL